MQIGYDSGMDTDQMRYFLDVAETEHMTRSARRLHVAQPALSRSIARLEQELGVQLFYREGRGLRLTSEGKLFQQRLRPVFLELAEACSEVSQAANTLPSQVRVHLGAASHIAANAIAEWMVLQPEHGVVLTQSAKAEGDKVDVVVDSRQPEVFAEHQCFSERVMIACPAADASGFSRVPVPLDELRDRDFISLSFSSGFSRFTHELCAATGFEPHVTFESDNPSVVRKMIGLGLGVGFWPERSWGSVTGGDVSLLPLDIEQRRMVHVWLARHSQGNALAEGFYQHLCSYFGNCFH